MHRFRSLSMITLLACVVHGCAPSDGASSDSRIASAAPAVPGSATPDSLAASSLVAAGDRGRILGDSGAPVWVVIVSDFQCPFCKVWHDETFPALKREFVDPGTVRVAYVNLPLPQHQHARVTAELALCAGVQGRFWEYHDALFDSQQTWSALPSGTPFFRGLAGTAGADGDELQRCVESGAMRPLVEADFQRSMTAQVRSTPTFLIGNGIRLEGAQPIAAFRDAIAAARRVTPAAGRR